MSLTRAVPVEEPSLFHSSLPWLPSLAEKKSVPPTFLRKAGEEPEDPGRMSLTRDGPEAEPPLFPGSWGALPLPQLRSVAAFVCVDDTPPFLAPQVGGVGGGGAGSDVVDEGGAGGGAVALPQLQAVAAVVGHEEQRAAHVRQVGGIGAEG